MRTRFTPLLKVRQEKLDRLEAALQAFNYEIMQVQARLEVIVHEIRTLEIPSQGSYGEFLMMQAIKGEQMARLELEQLSLASLQQKKREVEENMRLARIEYEKAKYLDRVEIQKVLATRAREEAREMDEIAGLLFLQSASKRVGS